MNRNLILTLFVTTFFIGAAQAQTPTPAHHQLDPSQVNIIDGEHNPELIPDSLAYRMYLLVVATAPNPTPEERVRQSAHLGMIGLQDEDRKQLITVLTDFRSRYDALVNDYNLKATAAQAKGQQVDPTLFLQQRDDLVQSARDSLQRVLSSDGMGRVHTVVQKEKKRMKIHTTTGAPQ